MTQPQSQTTAASDTAASAAASEATEATEAIEAIETAAAPEPPAEPPLAPDAESPPDAAATLDAAAPSQAPLPAAQGIGLVNPRSQLRLTSKAGQLSLVVPAVRELTSKIAWVDLLEHLKNRLQASEKFWSPGTAIQLRAADQLLDGRQLQAIAETLAEVGLKLNRVLTSRRQTAVAAAAAGYAVEPQTAESPTETGDSAEHWAEPLYVKSTLRSGAEVQHPGSVIVFGDVNPGSSVVASGDVLVLGRLRGIAHAGAQGNRSCQIMALQMQATQLRIADAIARPPETPPEQLYPEVAYMAASGIRLARAVDFFRSHSFSMGTNSWQDVETRLLE